MAEEEGASSAPTTKEILVRALYMLLFAVIYNVAEVVVAVVAVFQLGMMLAIGRTNQRLLLFGNSLSSYIYQVWRFLTFNSEVKPYPFSTWPKGTPPRRKRNRSRRRRGSDTANTET